MLVRNFDYEIGSFIMHDVLTIEKNVINPWKNVLKSKSFTFANNTLDDSRYFLIGNSSLNYRIITPLEH